MLSRLWNTPFIQVIAGTLVALGLYALLPPWAAPPLPVLVATSPPVLFRTSSESVRCREDDEAVSLLGNETWYVRAISYGSQDRVVIVSRSRPERRGNGFVEPASHCIVMPLGFHTPNRVMVRDGKLVAAD